MYKLYYLSIFISLFLTACGGSVLNTTGSNVWYSHFPLSEVQDKYIKYFPDVDKIITISPGETLIYRLDVISQKGIMLEEDIQVTGQFNGFNNTYSLNRGEYPLIGENENALFYGKDDSVHQVVIVSGTSEYHYGGLLIPKNQQDNHYIFFSNYKTIKEPLNRQVDYHKTEIINASEPSFKQELIYTGKSGNSIMIEYREFKDNMARPAFSQTLTYDISEDKVIGFRNCLIEVIRATNSSIEYKVLRHLQ